MMYGGRKSDPGVVATKRANNVELSAAEPVDLIPNMPDQRLRPLIERYQELLSQNRTFSAAFGIA